MARYYVGQKASISRTYTRADVEYFSNLSGDFNPLHLDEAYAKNTRFGKPILHGLLTASLLSGLLGSHLPGHGSIYLGQTIRFVKPVYAGDTITANAEVIEYKPDKGFIRLKTFCSNQHGEIVLEGEASMLVPKEEEK
jgi:acyl dehydratase